MFNRNPASLHEYSLAQQAKIFQLRLALQKCIEQLNRFDGESGEWLDAMSSAVNALIDTRPE